MRKKLVALILSITMLSVSATNVLAVNNNQKDHSMDKIEESIRLIEKLERENKRENKSENFSFFKASVAVNKRNTEISNELNKLKQNGVKVIEVDNVDRAGDIKNAVKSGYNPNMFKNNTNYRLYEKAVVFDSRTMNVSKSYFDEDYESLRYNSYPMRIIYLTADDTSGTDAYDQYYKNFSVKLSSSRITMKDFESAVLSVGLGFTTPFIWVPYTFLPIVEQGFQQYIDTDSNPQYTVEGSLEFQKKYVVVLDKDSRHYHEPRWRTYAATNLAEVDIDHTLRFNVTNSTKPGKVRKSNCETIYSKGYDHILSTAYNAYLADSREYDYIKEIDITLSESRDKFDAHDFLKLKKVKGQTLDMFDMYMDQMYWEK